MITTLGVPLVPRRPVGPAAQPPSTGPLTDSYGRMATDLRVSLTDRCNLRCTYCMPAAGLPWLAAKQPLQPDEIIRLVRIGVARLGITKGERSAYDQLMLSLHDTGKLDQTHQKTGIRQEVSFPAGTTWMCFTDQVLHAAMAGQFALEQTFHIDVAAMAEPDRSPLRVLERLTSRALV